MVIQALCSHICTYVHRLHIPTYILHMKLSNWRCHIDSLQILSCLTIHASHLHHHLSGFAICNDDAAIAKGPSINYIGNWVGGGVINWSKLPTDSTKKLPTWRKGVSKIQKNCRRCLWMIPNGAAAVRRWLWFTDTHFAINHSYGSMAHVLSQS